MLEVRNLAKRYDGAHPVEAVRGASLELEPRRFLAVVGRSGSGKSTLLGMIGAISRPSSGHLSIAGVDPWSLNDDARADFRNRTVGFVFQFASLLPTLRALDNVAIPALVGNALAPREAYARARVLLDRVGLGGKAGSYPGELSGGEQRRVAIARALINSPVLLLADEPTADLDEETEREILELLIDIHQSYGITLVVVTHNPVIAARADRVIRMTAGQTVEVERMAPQPQMPPPRAEGPAHAAIYDTPPPSAANEPVTLGLGIERTIGRLVIWIAPILLLAWAVNWGVARYQRNLIEARAQERSALEQLAMAGLRADIKDIVFGPGETYLVTLYLRNTTGGEPIYVMAPAVRGFVQVGGGWQEVALRPAGHGDQRVLKITGTQTYQYVLAPDVRDFEQLLPYYMHVRLSNDMLVSPRAEPKDDLVERSDNYYVYLKPHAADDAMILKKLKFPGPPPVWIPMPPH